MAFINAPVILSSTLTKSSSSSCTLPALTMTASPSDSNVSRRAFLQSAAIVAATSGLLVLAPKDSALAKKNTKTPTIDSLQDIDKQVDNLSYEDELFQNPDPSAKQKYDIPKKVAPPQYVEAEKKISEKENESYESMLVKEKQEAEALKQKFAKK